MPEERVDIHRMGWRFANACLIKLKLSDVQNASWWQARATLERLLEDLITQAVRRRWGQLSLDVTLRTVAIALDSIRACNLYYLSPQILRLYVLSAFRVLNKQPPEEAERNCRPEWYLVLAGLIDLTRAPWTYLRLAAARSVGFGWKRRLTRDYLGPKHEPLLTGHVNRRRHLERALGAHYAHLQPAAGSSDPLERLLWALNQLPLVGPPTAAAGAGRPCAGRAAAAAQILQAVVQHRPADGYRSGSAADAGTAPEREALANVLDEIARRFGTDLSSVASEAAEELCREIHAPGSVLPQAPSLLAVLRTCPPEHQGQIERPPEEVLAAIRGYEVRQDRLPPDEPLGEVIPHDQLVHRVGLQIAADEPLRGGFVALLLGYGFPEIGQGLERWSRLSHLGDLMAGGGDSRDWVARTRIVLLQWRAYIEAASDGTDQISGFAAKEIPDRLWEEYDLIARAAAQLQIMLADADPRHHAWDRFPQQLLPALRAALAVVLVEDLVRHLGDAYKKNPAP